MDKEYWNSYYAARKAIHFPSPFCEYCCNEWIAPESRILELGCGNGRDAFYLAENGHTVVGLDQSDVAVADNTKRISEHNVADRLTFIADDFTAPSSKTLDFDRPFDVVYSRFTLHSVTEAEQQSIIKWVYEALPSGGSFLIECRTKNDPLFSKGKRISASEAITDHYRRFADANVLLREFLAIGFQARFFIERDNLAVFGSDNPVVARYVLAKQAVS
jgi:SAM-dependent methyltransferase